jgi:hypothetical protein
MKGLLFPDSSDLQRCIVSLCHDTRVAGHAGRWKTLELVSRNYWWPQMSRYVGRYVSTCDPCLRTKAQKCHTTGELHPLPIPRRPMGHHQRRLHSRVTGVFWPRRNNGGGGLGYQMSTFRIHPHHRHSLRNCSAVHPERLEAPWSPPKSSVGLRTPIRG